MNINLLITLLALTIFLGCNRQNNQTPILISVPFQSTNNYKDGKKDGLWKTYYQNGQLKTLGNYTLDLKEGLHRQWQDNGILLLEGFYKNGKANGWMKWYHEKGHLAAEGNMIDEVRVGPWKICDVQENGFCIEAHFKEGKRDGVWKIYHEHDETKLWKEQMWKDDKVVAEKCWDDNGNEIECY